MHKVAMVVLTMRNNRTLLLGSISLSLLFSLHAAPNKSELVPDTMWTYKVVGGKELKFSVFLPKGYEKSKQNYPVFVVYHGGSWTAGEAGWRLGSFRQSLNSPVSPVRAGLVILQIDLNSAPSLTQEQ